ncbi:class I SAM-dependent methyltransferase [Paracraurococcus ruber]|uniref:SAM-dependent methyltransferase n=1 Tax=Paracraurococcus ruber TaxID=77675 RepID=A0ABS1CY41_9PROT|nr:class I SAM-dependent methyltransferase [Paracraurococcus ruber]MBK1658639.1 SAM-dependent methyltransferase [Paracraurococcus ruber]TDG32648.1 methyltransferase domain-containing protein [Paracraurococcus ruber]
MSGSRPVTACRACGGRLGLEFCDLGAMAVANSYVPPERAAAPDPAFPLRCMVCEDCRLVQLDTVVDERGIFSDYAYLSSMSSTWLDHAARFCAAMVARLGLGPASFVVEVASNDGYLLRNFVAAGIPCLGVEPAANVAAIAQAAGIPTEARFFGRAAARDILAARGTADLVVANNVLAHVPDLDDFIGGLALLAGARGVVSIEAPHLVALVDGVQFDTIYHEHYAYWSLLAMEAALARHGLRVFEVERLPTHGGSLRVLASAAAQPVGAGLLDVRAEEAARGLSADAFYRGFGPRVRAVLDGLRAWLADARAGGRRVCAYGAAAKGNTLLNAARVTAADILAVADRSPEKQGRLLPGSRIPVVSPEALLALAPDDILILPWNIEAEVTRQLRGAGHRGRLAVAVPAMRVQDRLA